MIRFLCEIYGRILPFLRRGRVKTSEMKGVNVRDIGVSPFILKALWSPDEKAAQRGAWQYIIVVLLVGQSL